MFELRRLASNEFSTRSEFLDEGGAHICFALERGVANPDHVRIPAGTYCLGLGAPGQSKFDHELTALLGSAYRGILQILGVPGRSNIEIHPANWVSELEGCVAPGLSVVLDQKLGYVVPGGGSRPAYAILYPLLAQSGARLSVIDETAPVDQNIPTA